MKILLCCKAGVTSNMFASALKDEAKSREKDITVWAVAETNIEYSIESADVVLVTPQLRSSLNKIKDYASSDTPVKLIENEDFVNFNVSKILDEVL